MEQEFDEISRGEREWVPVIREFYDPFQEALAKASEAIPDEASGLVCEKCGEPMTVKAGRNGRFLSCSGYPKCKNAKPLPGQEPEETDIFCEKCERPMLIKVGTLWQVPLLQRATPTARTPGRSPATNGNNRKRPMRSVKNVKAPWSLDQAAGESSSPALPTPSARTPDPFRVTNENNRKDR